MKDYYLLVLLEPSMPVIDVVRYTSPLVYQNQVYHTLTNAETIFFDWICDSKPDVLGVELHIYSEDHYREIPQVIETLSRLDYVKPMVGFPVIWFGSERVGHQIGAEAWHHYIVYSDNEPRVFAFLFGFQFLSVEQIQKLMKCMREEKQRGT